jgi:hypothetical protein
MQEWYLSSKDKELFSSWDNVCSIFISTPEIASEVCAVPILSPFAIITDIRCAGFIADEVLSRLDGTRARLIDIQPDLFLRFAVVLAEKSSYVSDFLATSFVHVFHFFVEAPSIAAVQTLIKLFGTMWPKACPVHSRQFAGKVCDIGGSLGRDVLIAGLDLLVLLAFCPEIVKRVLEFILVTLRTVNPPQLAEPVQAGFPVEAIEPPPLLHTNPVVKACLAALVTLAGENLAIVVHALVSGSSPVARAVGFDALGWLLKRQQVPDDRKSEVVSEVLPLMNAKLYEPGLSQLAVDLLYSFVLPADQVSLVSVYVADSAMAMGNSYFFLQLARANQTNLTTIFGVLADFLVADSRFVILSSVMHTLNLLLLRRIGDGQTYVAHESDEEGDGTSVLHPLVPIFVKLSIAEKSIYLLRILSSLMAHGALHEFVPSMLENLTIFCDFAFPMAATDLRGIIDSTSRCINSSSEFPSLVMSLLAKVMRLLNDRQFRISLCAAVIHEAEPNVHVSHTRNCLAIFGTIVPFLPADVAAANLQKLFGIIPIEDQSLGGAFADLLGLISNGNASLVVPFLKTWVTMRSNSAFPVGKTKSPISYQFIARALASVARDIELEILLGIANSDLFALLVNLTKRSDVTPGQLLTGLSELCTRLTFQRNAFVLGQSDYLFKFVIRTFVGQKQRSVQLQALTCLRLLIQVRPCLTQGQWPVLTDKVLNGQNLAAALVDAAVFAEFRGLVLAVICVMPYVEVLVILLRLLMPHFDNSDVSSMVLRLLSMFDSYARGDPGSIKFFAPITLGRIKILPRLIVDMVGGTDRRSGFEMAGYVVNIDRATARGFETPQELFSSLSPQELGTALNITLESLSKGPGYTFVLAELMKLNDQCMTPGSLEQLTCDILNGTIQACSELIVILVLRHFDVFLRCLLSTGVTVNGLQVTSSCYHECECVELLVQQACISLLSIPDDDEEIIRLFRVFEGLLSVESRSIPLVHVFQLVASLLIFGIAAHEFEEWEQLFVPEFRALSTAAGFGVLKPAEQREQFKAIWSKTLGLLGPDLSSATPFDSIVRYMFKTDESLLIQVMNFLMSTCQLTNPRVSSAISIWAGDVLMQLEIYDCDAHIFQLYFSSLLTFGPLFDYVTCVSSLNAITKVLSKPTVTSTTFPAVYISRILQVLFRRSSVDEPDVSDAVSICAVRFCRTFSDAFSETLCEFMFNLIVGLLHVERFGQPISVVDVLEAVLACELPPAFAMKFRLLARLTGYHSKVVRQSEDLGSGEPLERAAVVVAELFLGAKPWMICAAIEFLREELPKLVPTFETRLTELLDSPEDSVAAATQSVVPLIFPNQSD